MKAHTASSLNAIVLIACSAWGYLLSEAPSPTALIPAAFGAALLACYKGVKAENKVIGHIAALITVLLLLALFMPLRGALAREDTLAVIRVGIMLASTALALAFFIKSFIDARRQRT